MKGRSRFERACERLTCLEMLYTIELWFMSVPIGCVILMLTHSFPYNMLEIVVTHLEACSATVNSYS